MQPFRLLHRLWHVAVRLRRLRHRCGYGIHSPFAFAKVTGVIYERGAYYAYAPLQAAHPSPPDGMTHGDLRLLLRLANETHPRRGWIVDRSGSEAPRDYLKAGCTSCRWAEWNGMQELPEGETADFLYIDMPGDWAGCARSALPRLTDRSAVVIRGIGRDAASRRAWRWLQSLDEVRVTFDLYDFGIAYMERRLNKEDYIICYP